MQVMLEAKAEFDEYVTPVRLDAFALDMIAVRCQILGDCQLDSVAVIKLV